MTDLVTYGETPLRLSPPGTARFETATDAVLHADGTESNVSVAAACLGADTTWISKLPDTPPGRRIVREIEQHGVETEITWADSDARIGISFHEEGAVPRESGHWEDREGATAGTIVPGDIPMELVQNAAVIFSGVSTPLLSDTATETVRALLRAGGGAGATTVVDLDYQPGLAPAQEYRRLLLELLEHVDVLVANEETARTVLNRTGQARQLANSIVAEHDLEMGVITRSERGAVVLHDTPGTNVIHERETIETDTVDTSGQHEALIGGFVDRLSEGTDAAEALSYGVAMSVLARTMPGPLVTVDRETVIEMVDDVIEASR